MKQLFLVLLSFALTTASFAQSTKSEILLLGTFHFDNPGADLTKVNTFDVTTPKAQAELEKMTTKISGFHPDKIFVEWDWSKQAELDELYQAYLGENYEQYVTAKYDQKKHAFFLKSEIIQLAFRAGKKTKLSRIHALDYRNISLPFDSVMNAMKAANQTALMQKVQDAISELETSQNKKIEKLTLTQLLLDTNTEKELAYNKSLYIDLLNRAGKTDNFAGAFLVSEWYRRNLYMYSFVQKNMAAPSNKALVLVGSGHAAMMKEFIESDQQFRLKALKEVLK